eukprot:scpid109999/ scgid28430/ 
MSVFGGKKSGKGGSAHYTPENTVVTSCAPTHSPSKQQTNGRGTLTKAADQNQKQRHHIVWLIRYCLKVLRKVTFAMSRGNPKSELNCMYGYFSTCSSAVTWFNRSTLPFIPHKGNCQIDNLLDIEKKCPILGWKPEALQI